MSHSMKHWTVSDEDTGYFWAILVEDDRMLKQHPIPFTDIREAHRAVARLNARDKVVDAPV
jgi:hypothetical protein